MSSERCADSHCFFPLSNTSADLCIHWGGEVHLMRSWCPIHFRAYLCMMRWIQYHWLKPSISGWHHVQLCAACQADGSWELIPDWGLNSETAVYLLWGIAWNSGCKLYYTKIVQNRDALICFINNLIWANGIMFCCGFRSLQSKF